jgi:hypothetical protein
MFVRSIAATVALGAALAFNPVANAGEEAATPATIIVYRADESIKTSRLRPAIHVNGGNVSRLDREEVLVLERAPGQYTLDSSIPGTDAITLDLKPGATYYVHSELKMRGSQLQSTLVEVEEQVARVQQPDIGSAI